MGETIRLGDYRKGRKNRRPTYFNRDELNRILNVYSKRVAAGEWRDYAIDHTGDFAIFSIFRHSHERPVFGIAKSVYGTSTKRVDYALFDGPKRIKNSSDLSELLKYREKRREIVKGKRER